MKTHPATLSGNPPPPSSAVVSGGTFAWINQLHPKYGADMAKLAQALEEMKEVLSAEYSCLFAFLEHLEKLTPSDAEINHLRNLVEGAMPLLKKNPVLLRTLLRDDEILRNAELLDLLLAFFCETAFGFNYVEPESFSEYLKKHDGDKKKAKQAKQEELRLLFSDDRLVVLSVEGDNIQSEIVCQSIPPSYPTGLKAEVMANCKSTHFHAPIALYLTWVSHGTTKQEIKKVTNKLGGILPLLREGHGSKVLPLVWQRSSPPASSASASSSQSQSLSSSQSSLPAYSQAEKFLIPDEILQQQQKDSSKQHKSATVQAQHTSAEENDAPPSWKTTAQLSKELDELKQEFAEHREQSQTRIGVLEKIVYPTILREISRQIEGGVAEGCWISSRNLCRKAYDASKDIKPLGPLEYNHMLKDPRFRLAFFAATTSSRCTNREIKRPKMWFTKRWWIG